MKIASSLGGLAAILLAFAPTTANAAIINGELKVTGSVIVDAMNIDWTPPDTGQGLFNIDPFVNTGFFQTLAGTTGDILDLNLGAAPVGVPNLGITNFLTFAANPSLSFTLDLIAPGPYSSAQCGAAPAAGQTCTFPGSPFGLTNASANSSSVELVLFGTVSDGSGDPASNFRGTYTAQFNTSFQELLDTVFVQGGNVSNTYSATFAVTGAPQSTVPEPTTILLFGVGLLGLAAMRKRI